MISVLALAGINALAVVVFALIYAAAGWRQLTQGAFIVSLVVFFVALTALWVRVERCARRERDPLGRIGRSAAALVLVVIGFPALVLAPLFAAQHALPPEAGLAGVLRAVMVLLLISLALTVVMNLTGVVVLLVLGLATRLAALFLGVGTAFALAASRADAPWLLVGHLGGCVAMVLLGAGAFSLDARLHGRRVIHLQARRPDRGGGD